MDRRTKRILLIYAGIAVGLLACLVGLRVAAGRLGLAIAVGIAFVTLVARQPIGFALSQAAVAAVLTSATPLPVLMTVEAGLVVTLLAPFGRVSTTGHTVAVFAISLLGFLAIAQVFRSGFGLLVAAFATVCGLTLVVSLIHRIACVRLETVTEGAA